MQVWVEQNPPLPWSAQPGRTARAAIMPSATSAFKLYESGTARRESAFREGRSAWIAHERLAERRWFRLGGLRFRDVWRLWQLGCGGPPGLEALDGVSVERDHLLARLPRERALPSSTLGCAWLALRVVGEEQRLRMLRSLEEHLGGRLASAQEPDRDAEIARGIL